MSSSYRSRSRSPVRVRRSSSVEDDRVRRRRRDKDGQDKDSKPLPHGAQPLSDADYFLKNAEFRSWLQEEKDRFFDELSGAKARSYFHKFVKAWNRGKLPKSYYTGEKSTNQPATSQTAYRWSFASKRSRAEQAALDETRSVVNALTTRKDPNDVEDGVTMPARARPSRVLGPTLPSANDRILMHEAQGETRAVERSYERKRAREEDKERVEDIVGPKERGREGMLEKKKMRREADKAVRDAKDDTSGEYDDSTLMGGGDSFQARLAQRDAARKRFEEKRATARDEKGDSVRERQEAIRAKDRATMEMFKQMAKEKFGS